MWKNLIWSKLVPRAPRWPTARSTWTSSSTTKASKRASWYRLLAQMPWKVVLKWKLLKKRYQTNSKWTKGALRWSPIELPWVTLPRSACEYLTERGDEDEIYTCFVGCKNIQKMCRVSFIPWEERKKFYHEEKHFCKRSCCFLQTNMSAATEKPAPACFIFPSSWRLSTHLIRKMGEKMVLGDGYQLPIN